MISAKNNGLMAKDTSQYFSAISIQRFLLVLMAAGFTCLVYSFFYPLFNQKLLEPSNQKASNAAFQKANLQFESKKKSLDYYLAGVGGRQVFSSVSTEDRQPSLPQALTPADTDITKNLSLVGVLSGDNPQAVIEDKKEQKTYYLNKGQYIGDLQIEDIKTNSVILNRNSQKYELFL